jgi:4'-phosphopantetheinyl transferase
VWLLDTADGEVPLARLQQAERERCLRFRQHADRVRFAQSRLALRALLGQRLGVSAHTLVFEAAARGKPQLAARDLQFNVSHSGRYALIAISDTAPVGIDLERIDHARPFTELAERYYAPGERAACRADPDAFFHLWSRKEAVVKAWGSGLGDGLPALMAEASGAATAAAPDATRRPATVWDIAAVHGYAAALAIA